MPGIILQRPRFAGQPPRVHTALRVVILAAGGSRRLGRPKQFVRIGADSLLRRAARVALALRPAAVLVVTGAHAARAAAELRGLPVTVVRHRGWRTGQAGSLRAGLGRTPRVAGAVLVFAVDQWQLTVADLERLLRARRRGRPAAALHDGAPGVPTLWPRAFWPRLRALKGDRGARELLRGADVVTVALPHAAADLDTPAALVRLRRTWLRGAGSL